jgi:hypothetical protein
LRNSFDALPSERASFGSCELPNSNATTARMMSRSGPMISPMVGVIAPPFFGHGKSIDGGLRRTSRGAGVT